MPKSIFFHASVNQTCKKNYITFSIEHVSYNPLLLLPPPTTTKQRQKNSNEHPAVAHLHSCDHAMLLIAADIESIFPFSLLYSDVVCPEQQRFVFLWLLGPLITLINMPTNSQITRDNSFCMCVCVRANECGGYREHEVSQPGNGNSISTTYRSFVIVPSSFLTDAHMREKPPRLIKETRLTERERRKRNSRWQAITSF